MEVRDKIIEIMMKKANEEGVSQEILEFDDLHKIVPNSLVFVEIVVEIEKEFHFEFDDDDLDYNKYSSLSELCDYVVSRMKPDNHEDGTVE